MIEVDIPSIDPIQHEPKLIFGMTMRQTVCAIVGGGLGIGLYFLLQGLVGVMEISMGGFLICALPAVLLGWYKPYNMKAEDYAQLVYYNNFIAYPTRILKSDGADDVKLPTLKERQEMERKLQQQAIRDKKAAYAAQQKQLKLQKGGPK
jgi:hypothetical protein